MGAGSEWSLTTKGGEMRMKRKIVSWSIGTLLFVVVVIFGVMPILRCNKIAQ